MFHPYTRILRNICLVSRSTADADACATLLQKHAVSLYENDAAVADALAAEGMELEELADTAGIAVGSAITSAGFQQVIASILQLKILRSSSPES